MKKFLSLMAALLLTVSVALADCSCGVSPAVVKIVSDMCYMDIAETVDELDALSAIAAQDMTECRCEVLKTVLLRALVDHYETVTIHFSAIQVEAIRQAIIHCGCCGEETVTKKPVQQGNRNTHTHKASKFVSLNSTNHQAVCSCGYTFDQEAHNLDKTHLIRIENGLKVYRCKTCKLEVYIYAGCDWCYECSRPVYDCCPSCQCYGCAG